MKKQGIFFLLLCLLLCALALCGCEDTEAAGADCTAGHSFGESVVSVAAGCTEAGSSKRTCTVCGEEEITALPAAGHSFGEATVKTPAGCLTSGVSVQSCTVCGVEQTATIPATGHSFGTPVVQTAPSCTAAGSEEKTCTACGRKERVTVAALGHTEGEWITDTGATCESAGSKHKSCTVCGDTVQTATISALGHTAGSWVTDVAAGCETAGHRYKACGRCGDTVREETIPATGHSTTLVWKEPTDVPAGTVADYLNSHCSACDKVIATEKKERVVITEGANTTLTLSGYRLVYPASCSTAFKQHLVRVAEAIARKTGQAVSIVPDTQAATSKEILIGNVDRPQTQTALQSVTGFGYTVQVLQGKIVIVGTTELITIMGMEYFEKSCLSGTGTRVTLASRATSDHYRMVTLADESGIYYAPVYDADLDTDAVYNEADYVNHYGAVNLGTGRDFAYDAALSVREVLIALMGGTAPGVTADTAAATTGEIQIGRPDRAQTAALLASLEGSYYGVALCEGRVVATAWSQAGIKIATALLQGYLADAVYVAAGGARSICFPANFKITHEVNTNWYTLFPKPDTMPLYNTEDVGDSSVQYLYMGEGVDLAAYQGYCRKLEMNGYTVLTQSNAEGSYFKTYVNTNKSITLQVSYNAYAHSSALPSGQAYAFDEPTVRVVSARVNSTHSDYPRVGGYTERYSDDIDTIERVHYHTNGSYTFDYFNGSYRNALIRMGYTVLCEDLTGAVKYYTAKNNTTGAYVYVEHMPEYTTSSFSCPAMRILYKSRGVINLPTSTMLNPTQSYTKVTDSAITAVKLPGGAVGTGYVITLEDGRFVIIDGGSSNGQESPRAIYEILTDLYTKVWGVAPTPEKPITIAAWYITHSHGDHIGAIWDFAKEGREDLVKLENLIANVPAMNMMYNTGEPSETLRREMTKIHGYFGGFNFIKVHTGQKLYFANMTMEVLYTPEDLIPQRAVAFNDTSVIIRLILKPTGGTPVSFVSMGDAYVHSARWISAMYGSYLQSDMVTMAHHGGPGTENAVYDLIAPKVLWWPHVKNSVYNGYLKSSARHCLVDQHIFYDISSVEYVYIADDYNITLFLRAAGPDYNNLYAANGAGATISYYSLPKSPSSSQKSAICAAKPVAVKKY